MDKHQCMHTSKTNGENEKEIQFCDLVILFLNNFGIFYLYSHCNYKIVDYKNRKLFISKAKGKIETV